MSVCKLVCEKVRVCGYENVRMTVNMSVCVLCVCSRGQRVHLSMRDCTQGNGL